MAKATKKASKQRPKPKAKRRAQTKTIAMGLGVFGTFVLKPSPSMKIELRDVPAIERKLGKHGRRLFIAFVQAFNAADRLASFTHLFRLNSDHAVKDGIGQHRSRHLLLTLILGTLYEALDALQGLRSAGVAVHVAKESASWNALEEIRLRWAKNPTLKLVRHSMAHHLGGIDDLGKGLATFRSGQRTVVFHTEGGELGESTFPIVLDVLLRGLAIDQDAYAAAFEQALTDQQVFGRAIQMLFCDVLTKYGVGFSGLTLDPRKPVPPLATLIEEQRNQGPHQ